MTALSTARGDDLDTQELAVDWSESISSSQSPAPPEQRIVARPCYEPEDPSNHGAEIESSEPRDICTLTSIPLPVCTLDVTFEIEGGWTLLELPFHPAVTVEHDPCSELYAVFHQSDEDAPHVPSTTVTAGPEQLVGLLTLPTEEQRNAVVLALATLCSGADGRKAAMQAGAMQGLLEIVRMDGQQDSRANAAIALACLCTDQSFTNHTELVRLFTKHGAGEAVVTMLRAASSAKHQSAAAHVCATLSESEQHRHQLVAEGVMEPLVTLLYAQGKSPNCEENGPTVRSLGALAIWKLVQDPEHREAAIQAGAIAPLKQLLQQGSESEKLSASAVLSRLQHEGAGDNKDAALPEGDMHDS